MMTLAVVAGVGARTAIAATAMRTGFLLRAGCAGMMQAPLVDSREEPITGCFLPTLDPALVGWERATELAVGAFREALVLLGDAASNLRMKLVLAVDEVLGRKGPSGQTPAAELLAALRADGRQRVPGLVAEVCARGAAGPAFVLEEALTSLGGAFDVILFGGVHTDYDPAVIAELEAAGRLYRDDHLDAIIPGEAAAFVILTRPDLARRLGWQGFARIHAFGTGYEKARPDNDEPAFDAKGLTVAARKAGSPLIADRRQAGWVLTDFDFELFRYYEWQAVSVRARALLCEPHYVDSPAQRLGRLGAAAMALHMALAYEAWRRGYAPHSVALSVTASDPGERAVVVMSAGD